MMHCGSQLLAPEGWRSLRAGDPYHFLRSRKGRILLLRFAGNQKVPAQVQLIIQSQMEFEEAIAGGQVVACPEQRSLPPWLSAFEDIDLSQIDVLRPRAKKSHASRIEDRLLALLPALQQSDAILDADHPDQMLNTIARNCQPTQNETRYRLWFYTYLCFGRNSWVLLPPFHNNGHHDRFAFPNSKQGRPNKMFGKHYGFGCRQDVVDTCINGWLKHSALKRSMQDIYRRTMISEFKCRTVTTPFGTEDFVQPEGKAFPSYWQFRYRVFQKFGLAAVQLSLYGQIRHRNRLAATKGAFSEAVSNLMERVEADAYNTDELPKGFIEGSTLPALSVVVGRDVLSGLKLGIGFSFGAERNSAYRAMLFSMAVPKDFYCSLFGIQIEKKHWPNEGLPGFLTLDRGPGASKTLQEDLLSKLPIRELAPSWTAQSKATVESSHPRDTKVEGAPMYRQSDLNPVQLAKQEIYRLLNYNRTADMSERFQPIGDLAYVPPDPLSLWEYYDGRFRNDALPMPIAEAVRAFLIPVELTVTEKGVWLYEQCYLSKSFRDTGLLDKLKRSSKTTLTLQGYMLEMAVRHLWVEHEGRQYMLDAKLRLRDDEELLFLSHNELEQWHAARQEVRSAFGPHQHAVTAATMQAFEADVGKPWGAGKLRTGKPKKDPLAQREFEETRQYVSGKKRA
jgi:hypothetical protein